MANRLVELALEALESRKAAIDAEIGRLRGEIATQRRGRKGARGSRVRKAVRALKPRKRTRSAAARQAQSQKMREYWARRKQAATNVASDEAKTSSKKPKK